MFQTLNTAQVAFFEEDYGRVAPLLLDFTERLSFECNKALSEVYGVLGVSLWRMGMRRLASRYLRHALEADAALGALSTPAYKATAGYLERQ